MLDKKMHNMQLLQFNVSALRNPRRTTYSKEHDGVMRKYGLDRHTASAYLIALRGIERYTTMQKAIV